MFTDLEHDSLDRSQHYLERKIRSQLLVFLLFLCIFVSACEPGIVTGIEPTLTSISHALDCLRDFDLAECSHSIDGELVMTQIQELGQLVEESTLSESSKMTLLGLVALSMENGLINWVQYNDNLTAGRIVFLENSDGGVDFYIVVSSNVPLTPEGLGSLINELKHGEQALGVMDNQGIDAVFQLDADRTPIEYEAEFFGHLSTYIIANGDNRYFDDSMPEVSFFLDQHGLDWTSSIYQYLSDMHFRQTIIGEDGIGGEYLVVKWQGFNLAGSEEAVVIDSLRAKIDFPGGFFPNSEEQQQ